MNHTKDLIKSIKTNLTDDTRFFWLRIVAVIGLLSSLLLSAPAWSPERTFPLSPIITRLTMLPASQDALFLLVLVSLTAGLFRTNFRKYLLSTGLVALLLLLLLDITRLQPWVLHYCAVLFLFSSLIDKDITSSKILDASRLIVGGIYFWSGLQKLNYYFFTTTFPWFTEHLWLPFGDAGSTLAIFASFFVPFIEMTLAIGLFTKRFRKLSVFGSALMLLLVLISLGPTGHNWNSAVWPWNIAIFGMVFLLFFNTNFSLPEFIVRLKGNLVAYVMIFTFWVVPAGNLVGFTDNYLAWSLYSGKVPEASILGNHSFLATLSPKTEGGELRFVAWTLDSMNLVPYPENRVFIDVFENICNKYTAQPMTLVIEEKKHQRLYKCNGVY
ncbi:hypothetical protein KC730_02395 [Candidatus Kaiserbacteria bacterium]|nr:hypothetical protein [Candidatus Kaiserbacteria bacterium]